MTGRLLPAGGGPDSYMSLQEVVKAAHAKAHRDASVQMLQDAFSGFAKQAEVVQSTSPPRGLPRGPLALSRGRGVQWAPSAADGVSNVHPGEMEKEAFVRTLLSAGRNMAGRMAARGGAVGRAGRLLQRNVRSPIRATRTGGASANVGLRSPLAAAGPPPIPKNVQAPVLDRLEAQVGKGGPFRTPGRAAQRTPPPVPEASTERGVQAIPDMTRHAKVVKEPPRKGLVRSILPGALLAGTAYGVYKGVPEAVQWAGRAANSPMAYNFGHQQYQYGYSPSGQAQF